MIALKIFGICKALAEFEFELAKSQIQAHQMRVLFSLTGVQLAETKPDLEEPAWPSNKAADPKALIGRRSDQPPHRKAIFGPQVIKFRQGDTNPPVVSPQHTIQTHSKPMV